MIKTFAKRGRDLIRRSRSRIAYESRVRNTPDLGIESPQNVLVLTVDCLRHDRVSQTGYRRDTTPYIDSLGTVTPAIAAAPWTYSSVPSILTGQYPHHHGAVYPDDAARNQDLSNPPNRVRGDVYTLAERLAATGYETRFDTAITTAALPLRGRFKTTTTRTNADAHSVLDRVTEWWNRTAKPKFAYVQLGDLHEPLQIPDNQPFGRIPRVDGVSRWRFEHGDADTSEFDRYRHARELLYDTLVRYVDDAIKQAVGELAGLEDTVIVVTSDHGEEFWEYSELEQSYFDDPRGVVGVGHGHALVPPVLEVPVATNISGVAADSRVSSVDIVPTILDELGARRSPETDGVALQAGGQETPVVAQEIAYGPNQISVTDGDDHLIYSPSRDESVLIDFATGEERTDPGRVRELLQWVPEETVAGASLELSQDVREQLSDLGYTE